MKQPSKTARVIRAIFRYLALVVLVIFFALLAPLWGLASNLVEGLTNQETYEKIVRDVGLGSLIADGLYKVEDLLPSGVMGYLQGNESARGAVDELNGALGQAVETAATRVVSQIPSYVAGERDELEGEVDLTAFKQQAVAIALKRVPGGRLMEGLIRRNVESQIPSVLPLSKPLMILEAVLLPLKLAVGRLLWIVDVAGVAALHALVWIALIAFSLARAIRWVGIALALAGAVGKLLDSILEGLIGLAVPEAVMDNHIFRALVYDAIEGFGSTAMILVYVGATMFVLSILVPLILKLIVRQSSSRRLGALMSAMRPRGGRATLLTAVALIPALIGHAFGVGSQPRRAVRASTGGYTIAARLFDFALPALVFWSLGVGSGAGIGGSILAIIFSGLFILFWFVRDRPRSHGGINFIDRVADLRRGRSPGRRAPAASLVRSLPLVGSMAACLFVHPWIAFGSGALIECASVLVLWPDRTLFDLVAGTRARRIGGGIRR